MLKRILTLALALLTVLSCLACNPTDVLPEGPSSEETTEPLPAEVVLTGETNYTIIRSDSADDGTNACASDLWKHMQEITGKILVKIDTDWVQKKEQADNDNFEILIGLTNRPESKAASEMLATYRDYCISVTENKIAIYANTAEHLEEAVEYFKSGLVFEGGVLSYKGAQSYVKKHENYKYTNVMLCGKELAAYSVIVPKDATSADLDFAEKIALSIALDTGYYPQIKDDSASPAEAEIVVGKTNRAVSSAGEGKTDSRNSYYFKTSDGAIACVAGSTLGYRGIMAEFDKLMADGQGTVASGVESQYQTKYESLEGKKVCFIGNSQTYYGDCVRRGGSFESIDDGYFYQICKSFGEKVTVRNCTIGGAGFRSLKKKLIENHPNYYNNPNGRNMDPFYTQDYVIFQQEGSSVSDTYITLMEITELFPPTTQFYFFVGDYDVRKNLSPTLEAARKSRDNNGFMYLPVGHMNIDIWEGNVQVPGGKMSYNKNSFVVDWKDSHHPNYLTGYITALTTYAAITGKSAVGADYSFVNKDTTKYYTNGTTNFPEILESPEDMRGIQQLIDEYLVKYNPAK